MRSILPLVGLLTACSQSPLIDPLDVDITSPTVAPDRSIDPDSDEAIAVLALLNDGLTDAALLDHSVGLYPTAAARLIQWRNGEDGVFGTKDDNVYVHLDQVLGTYQVGPESQWAMADYALDHGYPDGAISLTLEGTTVSADDALAMLDWANRADAVALDQILDARTVDALVATRPLAAPGALVELPYMGPASIERVAAVAAGVCDLEPALDLADAVSAEPQVWLRIHEGRPQVPRGAQCTGAPSWAPGTQDVAEPVDTAFVLDAVRQAAAWAQVDDTDDAIAALACSLADAEVQTCWWTETEGRQAIENAVYVANGLTLEIGRVR